MLATDVTREYRSCNCSFVNVTFSKSRFLQPHYWMKLAVMDKHKKEDDDEIQLQRHGSIRKVLTGKAWLVSEAAIITIFMLQFLSILWSFIVSFRSLFWFYSLWLCWFGPVLSLSSTLFLVAAGFRSKSSDKSSCPITNHRQTKSETSWWTQWSI